MFPDSFSTGLTPDFSFPDSTTGVVIAAFPCGFLSSGFTGVVALLAFSIVELLLVVEVIPKSGITPFLSIMTAFLNGL